MLKLTCLLVLVLLFCPCASYATTPDGHDTVSFKNGDTLTGTVVSGTSAGVVFSNSAVGSLTLKWSDLRSLEIQHEVRISYGESAATRNFTNPEITVGPSSEPDHPNLGVKESRKKTTSLKDVRSITPDALPSAPANPGWIPTISGSAAFVVSSQHQQTYKAGTTFIRNWDGGDGWPHQRTLIDLAANYDEKRKNPSPGSATITDYYIGEFQHLFFITSDKFYASARSDLIRNNSLGIFFEQAYGGGLGVFINRLQLGADLRFVGEHFYGHNPSASLAGAELSERYDFHLNFIREGAKLTETGIFLPVFNASRAWQTRGVVDLTVPITTKWSLTTKLEDYYVENAPSPFRKNYLNTSIGFKFSPTAKH